MRAVLVVEFIEKAYCGIITLIIPVQYLFPNISRFKLYKRLTAFLNREMERHVYCMRTSELICRTFDDGTHILVIEVPSAILSSYQRALCLPTLILTHSRESASG